MSTLAALSGKSDLRAAPAISVDGVSVSYPSPAGEVHALRGVSLSVAPGEVVAVMGENGSGKSTLLKVVAAFVRPSSGSRRFLGGERPNGRVRLAYVFQNADESLMPWLSNRRNMSFPVDVGPGAPQDESVDQYARRLELDLPLDRYPYQLSGGQRQTLCLARAFYSRPSVLLCDEAFKSLDHFAEARALVAFEECRKAAGFTALAVCHNERLAAFLADRVVFMKSGRVHAEIAVPLPRPRVDGAQFEPDFVAVESEISARLREVARCAGSK
jgi:NitT/TauT family transport system ATP-binding protein